MKFEELFALGYEYNRKALAQAIYQIDNYNNEPTSKEKKRELGYRKSVASNQKEKEIFEEYKEELLKDRASPLSYRVDGHMTEIDNERKEEIYDCVLNEINRIIQELN